MSYRTSPKIPSTSANDYNQEQLAGYLSTIHADNKNSGFGACQYIHGATAVANAYTGAVYSPTQQRLYFVPYYQLAQATWHYYDCVTGQIVPYTPGATDTSGTYIGGAYSPLEDKIYFSPYTQANGHTYWHYLNCATGAIGTYTPPGSDIVDYAYWGAVYTPTHNRIFYMPYYQTSSTVLHYVTCDGNMTVTPYAGSSFGAASYWGGCYAPTLDRIYFAPTNITGGYWHYVNCGDVTPSLSAYTAGSGMVTTGYVGATYSPVQDRVYFIPALQAQETTWHYVDCKTGNVVSYEHGITVPSGTFFLSGTYSPVTNRIYLIPYGSVISTWYYIDCNSGAVVSYTLGVPMEDNAYYGSTFCPVRNRIVLSPFAQSNPSTSWHYIQEHSTTKVSPTLVSGPLLGRS